jgi:hypothetical protein
VTLELDLEPPALSWLVDSYLTDSPPTLVLEHSGAELLATESDFSVSGCEGLAIEHLLGQVLVTLADCAEGDVVLGLAANSFADEHGNSAPAETLVAAFVLDLTDPAVTWQGGKVSLLDAGADVVVTAAFSEPVSYDLESAVEILGDAQCEWSTEASATAVQFSFAGCSFGTLELSWQPQSLLDQAGRTGPAELSGFVIEIVEPVVELPAVKPVEDAAETALEAPAEMPALAPEPLPADVPAELVAEPVADPVAAPADEVSEPVSAPVASPAESDSQVDSAPQQPLASEEPGQTSAVAGEALSDSGEEAEPQPGQQPESAPVAATPAPTSVSDELQAEPALAPSGERLEFAVSAERTEIAPVLIGAGVLAAGAALGAVLLLRRRLG